MGSFAWMAWTPVTALFFAGIALLLVAMGVWAWLDPRNTPRVGVLGIATRRGDRLFLSLLGAAFIHLGWIALAPAAAPLWGASLLAVGYAGLVFRYG
jgi:predicted small integral membrane protein